MECLVLGGISSGKSLFLRRLCTLLKGDNSTGIGNLDHEQLYDRSTSTIPTIGVDVIEVETKRGRQLKFREVGATMASQWFYYYKGYPIKFSF